MSNPSGCDDWIFTAHTVGRKIRMPVASYAALAVASGNLSLGIISAKPRELVR